MNLPGYEADVKLAEQLIALQLLAAPIALGMPHHPKHVRAYRRALMDAWEAGKLLPIKNLTLSNEDNDNAF